MAQFDPKNHLPDGTEPPSSDNSSIDKKEQNLLPNILLFSLNTIWAERKDWFLGVNMEVHHRAGARSRVPVVPDAFLSLGVPRLKGDQPRRRYVVWEEAEIVPSLAVEVVAWPPSGEYVEKLETYRKLGVLYYVIYNPNDWARDEHQSFEVYKLVEGRYEQQ
ncbi:MAG: Uma2 family endonuclease, partial [Phormidesmis sp.]